MVSSLELDLAFVPVPAGPVILGSRQGRGVEVDPDEMPQHTLTLAEFYVMRYPVTNEQYRLFVAATGHRPPRYGWPEGRFPVEQADHPVVGVNFQDCLAFCRWAAEVTGLPIRLLTEPEWEKAARGDDGRLYPWGNVWAADRCNSLETGIKHTTPVNRFSPAGDSPYGVADMVGNVSEWCLSMFSAYPYRPDDGRESLQWDEGQKLPWVPTWGLQTTNEPSRLKGMEQRVIRGGSYRQLKEVCRCAYRSWAAALHWSEDTGFRCGYSPS